MNISYLKDIINSAKFITNDLGGLPPVLCSRTTDTNKILATQVYILSWWSRPPVLCSY